MNQTHLRQIPQPFTVTLAPSSFISTAKRHLLSEFSCTSSVKLSLPNPPLPQITDLLVARSHCWVKEPILEFCSVSLVYSPLQSSWSSRGSRVSSIGKKEAEPVKTQRSFHWTLHSQFVPTS